MEAFEQVNAKTISWVFGILTAVVSAIKWVWPYIKEAVPHIIELAENREKLKKTIGLVREFLRSPIKSINEIITTSRDKEKATEETVNQERAPIVHNLFTLPTIFGFENELAIVGENFKKYRVIEIVGPGGIGKSTLSVTYATRNEQQFYHGSCFIQLAPVEEINKVASVAVETLGIPEVVGKPHNQLLTDFLKEKKILLLFDNCEHLAREVSDLIHEIHSKCPGVFILTTSQRQLDLGNISFNYSMDSLNTGVEGMTYDELITLDVVKLFEYHVKKVNPTFKLSKATITPVINICRAFNGLPLAIILAAGRTNMYSVEEVERRLDSFLLELKAAQRRGKLSRHTNMFDAIKWSYDLLNNFEQKAIVNLSVFADDFSLDAARKICFVGDNMSEYTRNAIVEQLSQVNLLKSSRPKWGEKRFFLLETIRQFGKEIILEERRQLEVQVRFCNYYQEFIKKYSSNLLNDEGNEKLGILSEQIANIRMAFIYMAEHKWNDMMVQCAAKFWRYWELRGDLQEGRERLEYIVLQNRDLENDDMEEVLNGLGTILYRMGELTNALKYYQQRLDVNTKLKNKVKIASSLSDIGNVYSKNMDTEKAISFLLKAKKHLDSIKIDKLDINDLNRNKITREHAVVQNNLAKQYTLIGKISEAKENFVSSIKLFKSIGNTTDVTFPLYGFGIVTILEKNYDFAESLLKESLKGRTTMENSRLVAQCLSALALIDIHRKKYEEAKVKLAESLKRLGEAKDPSLILETLMVTVIWLIHKGDIESASQLFSYIETKGKLALVYAYFLGITKNMLIENQIQFTEIELLKWGESGRMFDENNIIEASNKFLEVSR